MRKAYIVTKGDYSDYHIVGVFSSKKAADDFIEPRNKDRGQWDDEYRLEIWPMNSWNPPLQSYRVSMFKDGEVRRVQLVDPNLEDGELVCGESLTVLKSKRVGMDDLVTWREAPHVPIMYLTIAARDKYHAVKIANEKRLMLIAENRFKNGGHML